MAETDTVAPRAVGHAHEVKHGVEMLRHWWGGRQEARDAWLRHIEKYARHLPDEVEALRSALDALSVEWRTKTEILMQNGRLLSERNTAVGLLREKLREGDGCTNYDHSGDGPCGECWECRGWSVLTRDEVREEEERARRDGA